jgi:Flp pilus assembly pilin Flp
MGVVLATRSAVETRDREPHFATRESGKGEPVAMFEMLELRERAQERAQGLVEYGLIIALVAVLAIAGLIVFGPAVSSLLSKLGGSV